MVRKGSVTEGSLSARFSNCYWPGALVGSGSGLLSLLGSAARDT